MQELSMESCVEYSAYLGRCIRGVEDEVGRMLLSFEFHYKSWEFSSTFACQFGL